MIPALGLVGVAFAFDSRIAHQLSGTLTAGEATTDRQLDRFGDLTGILPIVGGIAIGGLAAHSTPTVRIALRAAASVGVATVIAQVAKHAIGRVRPYADPDLDATDFAVLSGDPAFPSGHATAAFALATSLGDDIGDTWARVGLYALAAGTGWARLAEHDHWLSDVVAGAVTGFVSARFVSGRLRVFGLRAPRLLFSDRRAGLSWSVALPGGMRAR